MKILNIKSLKQKNRYIRGFNLRKYRTINHNKLMDSLVKINSSLRSDNIINIVMSELRQLVDCDGISIFSIINDEPSKINYVNDNDNLIELNNKPDFVSGLLKKLEHKYTAFTTSVYSVIGTSFDVNILDLENYSMMVFPLLSRLTGKKYGILVFYRPMKRKFSLYDIDALKGFIELLSSIIEESICEKDSGMGKFQYDKYVLTAQLAAGVAHEINNPLQVIAGNAQLALKKIQDDNPLKRHLKTIIDESFYCKEITRSLIDFSEDLEFIKHKVDLNSFLAKTLKKFEKTLLAQAITLKTDYANNLNNVEIEEGSFAQVVYHVFTNAIQALEGKKDKYIEIVTRNISEDNLVEIQINDNGCGMDKETQKMLYTPFFTTREQGSGKGLGLSISYGIIQRHRGTIGVSSEPGQGTSFTIKLPAVVK